MSGGSASIGRGTGLGEAALWALSGLVVLTAHVAGAVWLMWQPPLVPADDAPPAAIMIELAEIPQAVLTEENEISPDQQTAETSAPAEKVPTLEETPPEEVAELEPEQVEQTVEEEPEPVEDEIVEEVVDPLLEETVVFPDDIEVPIPAARPKPPEPRREVVRKEQPRKPELKKPVKRQQQEQAASKAAVEARVQVTQSNRNASRQTASGVSSVSPARWQSRLMAHLERRKRYPSGARSRREQGTVYVRFRIDDGGNVLSVSLAGSSGFPDLDNEVLALVHRASPVPAPPPGTNKTITAPVRFSVR